MILTTKKIIFGTIFLSFIIQIFSKVVESAEASPSTNAVTTAKVNDLDLTNLPKILERIPKIGHLLNHGLNYIGEGIIVTNQILNGALARVAGGSTPCLIDLKDGFTCSGISKNGGVFGAFKIIVMGVPIPMPFRRLIIYVVNIGINPFMDLLFGGVPIKKN